MANYDVSVVAKYFIAKSTPGTRQNITNLKLQKLLYYAQGFYHSTKKEKLFKEKIFAWLHGPVVPEIYRTYKIYNFNEIELEEDFDFRNIDTPDREFLDKLWDIFKNFSGKQLEYLTHQEDPWNKAREGVTLGDKSNKEIPVEDISNYFEENYISKTEEAVRT